MTIDWERFSQRVAAGTQVVYTWPDGQQEHGILMHNKPFEDWEKSLSNLYAKEVRKMETPKRLKVEFFHHNPTWGRPDYLNFREIKHLAFLVNGKFSTFAEVMRD